MLQRKLHDTLQEDILHAILLYLYTRSKCGDMVLKSYKGICCFILACVLVRTIGREGKDADGRKVVLPVQTAVCLKVSTCFIFCFFRDFLPNKSLFFFSWKGFFQRGIESERLFFQNHKNTSFSLFCSQGEQVACVQFHGSD